MAWLKGPIVDGTVFCNKPSRGYFPRATAKTASYTVKASECGSLFTNAGATGAVTFTLPAKEDGLCYWFLVAADYDVVIAADAINTVVTFNNNSTADSVEFSTSSQKIGGMVFAYSDGTYWYLINLSTNTLTVNTS